MLHFKTSLQMSPPWQKIIWASMWSACFVWMVQSSRCRLYKTTSIFYISWPT